MMTEESNKKNTKDLVLYKFEGCPYCNRVIEVIDRLQINVKYRDIHEEKEALEELIRVGGKKTVPCLFIDGIPMYESSDIINYLENL